MSGTALKGFSQAGRLRAYAIGLVTAALIVLFAIAESLTERYVSDHSRVAGTAVELTIVALAALAFSPLHKRVEALIEAAITKRRREARLGLARLRNELTSIKNSQEMLHRVIEDIDKHMSAAASAIYLRYDCYRPEASSFDVAVETIDFNDPLINCLQSANAPVNPGTIRSAAPGELAFPMMAAGGLIGFVTVVPRHIEYEPEDLAALSALAEATGVALLAHDPLGTLPSDLTIVDSQELYTVPGFSGREEEFGAIENAFGAVTTIVAVVGMGGVGKSSVAREYALRHRDLHSVIWWLNAQTEDGIIDGLLRLGAMFVRGLDQLADRRAAAQRVINSVLSGFDKPALLVFDNLEDEHLARAWMPRSGAHALFTSRNGVWSADVTPIALNAWDTETAVAYLQRESGRSDLTDADARAIAENLGSLPLALAHAAAALRNLRMISPQRYLERITEHLKSAPRGAEYPRSVFATFNTAIVQAEQHAPGAAALLCFAASFAPDAIPDELFREPIRLSPEGLRPVVDGALDLRAAVGNDLRLDEALGALDRLSLLSFGQSARTYSMHRLVQLAARDLVKDTAAWPEFAVAAARAAFPRAEFSTWPQCERMLPHALVALNTLQPGTEPEVASDLARRSAIYLWARGDYKASEELCRRALAIIENARGPDHVDTSRALNNLAVLYMELCRFAEAEPLLERTVAVREKMLGSDHPNFANALDNLGIVYMELGRFEEAESIHKRALGIKEKAFGPNHPEVVFSLLGLGVLYRTQGRYAEAEALLSRVVTVREEQLGPDHPDVALGLMHLADVYAESSRYPDAEQRYVRALAIWDKALALLGPDHPDVAECLKGLAGVYSKQGRPGEAEELLTRSLAIRDKTLGADHPLTKNVREALDALRA